MPVKATSGGSETRQTRSSNACIPASLEGSKLGPGAQQTRSLRSIHDQPRDSSHELYSTVALPTEQPHSKLEQSISRVHSPPDFFPLSPSCTSLALALSMSVSLRLPSPFDSSRLHFPTSTTSRSSTSLTLSLLSAVEAHLGSSRSPLLCRITTVAYCHQQVAITSLHFL